MLTVCVDYDYRKNAHAPTPTLTHPHSTPTLKTHQGATHDAVCTTALLPLQFLPTAPCEGPHWLLAGALLRGLGMKPRSAWMEVLKQVC